MSIMLALALIGPQISYTETYLPGNEVDLNQGFYVCGTQNPRDVMRILLDVKDPVKRRKLAGQLGCPFRLTDREGPHYKIRSTVSDVCLDVEVVDDTMICGREGHQINVQYGKQTITVIQLSLDVDYD
jgi:hypothetical protein